MKVVRNTEHEVGANESATGTAHLGRVLKRGEDGSMGVAVVRFEDGARTFWHVHPGEQILYVIEGECRIGNADGEQAVLRVGDCVHIPAGEKHWHGATPGNNMAHISVTTIGAPQWLEPVED